jgi:hypothetical protein
MVPGGIRTTSFGAAEPVAHQPDRAVLYSTAPDSTKLLSTLLRRDSQLLSARAHRELSRIRPATGLANPDVVVYKGLFNSHCWVDWGSDTAGVLYTQLVPHGHRDMNILFDAYRAAVRAEPRSRLTPIESVLSSFNIFRGGAVWWF